MVVTGPSQQILVEANPACLVNKDFVGYRWHICY